MLRFAELDRILRDEDIEGLIALGAPQDEYTPEAEEITLRLNNLALNDFTEEQVGQVVMRVWDSMFGPFSLKDIEKRAVVLKAIVDRIMATCTN